MRLGLTSIAFLAAFAAISPAQALERLIDDSNDRSIEVTREKSL